MENGRKLSRLALGGLMAGLAALQACDRGRAEGNHRDTSPAVRAGSGGEADTSSARHGCRGLNGCKGRGGCAVTETQLKSMAAKAGIPPEKAGSPHDCKGKNECKGLGGCNM
jgi:hypothetical protein